VADPDMRKLWQAYERDATQRAFYFKERVRHLRLPFLGTALGMWQDLTGWAGEWASLHSPDDALKLAHRLTTLAPTDTQLLQPAGTRSGGQAVLGNMSETLRVLLRTRQAERSLDGAAAAESVERSTTLPLSRRRILDALGRPGMCLATMGLPLQLLTTETHLSAGCSYRLVWPGSAGAHAGPRPYARQPARPMSNEPTI
jgi:hypothetical protein